MKKMILGILITMIGLVYSSFSFIYATIHPWTYNGIGGLLGSFLGTGMLEPFVISTVIMCFGLMLCFVEAYRKH